MSVAAANPFPIVGVGASAGGLDALKRLFASLPHKPGLAVVVVQHLDPHHSSQLTQLLAQRASMPVLDASHGMKVEPDHAYVIQPNTNVAIADGVLSVTPRPDDRRPHYPIDHFLRSLAEVQGPRAAAVILSGTGADGTLGVCEIKAGGGVTFAQDEATAQYSGMPQSAVASGAVDLVLAPEAIAERLGRLLSHPYLQASDDAPLPVPDEGEQFSRVLKALRRTSGVDFSQYRPTTIKRRTARRMLLRGFEAPADYARLLEHDAVEAEALYRDVLINVTSFFREPEMFEELKRVVVPAVLDAKTDGSPIRVWVPGCSTGQEAYSIAITVLEVLAERGLRVDVQIFATDLGDRTSLERARAGVYPESIESEVSRERLARFFVKEGHTYRIQKHVRDLCVFARQNVTADPPFSRVDIVSFRNVLIYMAPVLQERLLPVFHFALNPGGFLVLGVAETIGSFSDLFEQVGPGHKIYRRKDGTQRRPLNFVADDWLTGAVARPPSRTASPPDLQREADRLTLARYAPPSVLIDGNFDILQFRGRTSPFLEMPAGLPTANLLRMVRNDSLVELQSALAEAKASGNPVTRDGLHVLDNGEDLPFTLRILPVLTGTTDNRCWLVVFESDDWPLRAASATQTTSGDGQDTAWLQVELASSRQDLQLMVDSQDSAVQELRAAHEEVLSSNEELQSTNEELETTKEELQSANEELTTVNEQFQTRNHELDALADALANFIASADVPMVTVGRDLVIRRLTPAAQQAFNLLPADVGRSIEHINFTLNVDNVRGIIDSVVASGQPWERDVTDRDGRWWVLRVRPYLTVDRRVDGATLVAIDIDSVRRSHELIEARDYALAIVNTVREPLVVLDGDCRVGLANDAFHRLFGDTPETVAGRRLWETGRGVWNEPALRRMLVAACAGREVIDSVELECLVPPLGDRTLVLNARSVTREGRSGLLLLSVDDVTDLRQADRLRIDAETLRLVDRRKDEFLGILAHELRNPLAPMRFALEILRQAPEKSPHADRARQVLDRQVTHMVRLIDDLLDVSRITQGKVELRRERLRLGDIVHAAVELCRPSIDAAQHTLSVSLPDEAVYVNGDAVRLTQVVVNLLNNAVKFTPPAGHVWLIVETTGENAESDVVTLRVRDTGIGIAPEMRNKVFDMFIQGDRTLERTRGGLGVGLTLVRNLVALHGGSVDVWSEGLDRGSEFIVFLPLDLSSTDQAPATDTAAGPDAAVTSLRIVVADDNQDGREMLTYLLQREGHEVRAAEDGRRAVEQALGFDPDVAILDIGMPEMNGFDVARQLRERGSGPRPYLIALSGLGQADEKARAFEAGFDHHFTKPVDVQALLGLLREQM